MTASLARVLRLAAPAATIALVAALAVAGSGRSASTLLPAAQWAQISGPSGAGQQLGLARVPGGSLHVIWNRGNPAPTSIFDTRLSANGAVLGTTQVASGWDGAGGLALLAMPDNSLELFASGGHAVGLPPAQSGVNVLTADANARGWTLAPGAPWGGAPAAAAPFVGATLTEDGRPVTSWAGGGASNVQVGSSDGGSGSQVCACSDESADVVTDGSRGTVVIAGLTIGSPAGTYVEQVLPDITNRKVLPSATQDAGDYGISARLGAPGIYVAYTDGGRPGEVVPAVRLYRYGGATRTLARGSFTVAKAFPGPDGRLWIDWGDNHGLFFTRSNKAVTRFEQIQRVAPPAGTSFLWNAQGEGSIGPLDLFVDATTGKGRGFWHTHVLPIPSLHLTLARTAVSANGHGPGAYKATVTVSDAGDPVHGAIIAIRLGGSKLADLKTDTAGKASVTFGGGVHATLTASATASGYAKTTRTVHVS